jgi:hypothetical protein
MQRALRIGAIGLLMASLAAAADWLPVTDAERKS